MTILLGKPFAKPLLNFFLRNRSFSISCIKPISHFLNHIQVILDILQRTIVRHFAEKRVNLFFSGTHVENLP